MVKRTFLAVIVLVSAALVVAGGCSPAGQGGQAARPVKIEGGEKYGSLFPSYITWEGESLDGRPGGLLLRDGDVILSVKGGTWFVYLASDGPAIKIAAEDWRTCLGDKTISLSLKEGQAGWDWLAKATPQDLAALRIVAMPEDLDAARLASLKPLAAANPNVGLVVEKAPALVQALGIFKPRVLLLGDIELGPEECKALAAQKQLETLLFQAKTKGSLDFLPGLPALKRLALGEWSVVEAGPLPKGCSALKSILVIDKNIKDLSPLADAPAGLEELSLLVCESLSDLKGLAKMTGLKTVILNGSKEATDLSPLAGLKGLRRLGLPPAVTQDQFAAVIKDHPDLKVLELVGCDGLTDLAPVKDLKGLEAIMLVGTYKNYDAVAAVKSLKFAAVFDKAPPDQVAAIQKALPDALVVPASPMCLGSGWLLALVPAVAGLWLGRSVLARRRRMRELQHA